MRIFRPEAAEGFEWVQPVNEKDFDAVYQLDGTPRAGRWEPIQVELLRRLDDEGPPLLSADLPWLNDHALVLRERARVLIGDLLASSGEFLELDLVDGTDRLWLFNVRRIVDALDEEASDVVRFSSTGRVMKVNRHVFRPDRVAGLTAFRVPQVRSMFLSGEAVDAISAAQLTGTEFELVWRDEPATSAQVCRGSA